MRDIGKTGENIAKTYLIQQDFNIIYQNFYCKFGEIDIIAKKNQHLHIIEVKYLNKEWIHSGYKINYKKQKRLIQSTQIFLERFKINNLYIQFDLITIVNKKLNHIPNIFNVSDTYS